MDINLSVWKIHRRIGMSGGLFVTALVRELETGLDPETLAELPRLHAEAYLRQYDSVAPLPGSAELLDALTQHGVPWAIATSGAEASARLALGLLGLPEDTPMVTWDQVRYAKPDPDLFLSRGRPDRSRHRGQHRGRGQRLGSAGGAAGPRARHRPAVGRLRPRGADLSGAFRVYEDPADLLAHLDEVGVRRPL